MIWLLFVALEIARNYVLIEVLDMRPHYGWSRIIRLGAGALFFFWYFPDPATMGFAPWNYALFQWTSFYVSFDLILNKLRGKDWDYTGKDSGPLDKLSKRKYHLLKAASLVILILTLIVIYGKG